MTEYRVYADFNCPFCYALCERLDPYVDQYEIDWRPIQHIPTEHSRCNIEDLSVLASEVFTVRHRAPEVTIAMPQTRPLSTAATQMFTTLRQRDPELARRFRTLIYRALWIEDLDISKPEVIANIVKEAGKAEEISRRPRTEDIDSIALWQREWEEGGFDGRIPTITASDGRVLKGLAAPADIWCFLEGRPAESEASGVCEFVPRPIVLVTGEPQNIWPLLTTIKQDQFKPVTNYLIYLHFENGVRRRGNQQ